MTLRWQTTLEVRILSVGTLWGSPRLLNRRRSTGAQPGRVPTGARVARVPFRGEPLHARTWSKWVPPAPSFARPTPRDQSRSLAQVRAHHNHTPGRPLFEAKKNSLFSFWAAPGRAPRSTSCRESRSWPLALRSPLKSAWPGRPPRQESETKMGSLSEGRVAQDSAGFGLTEPWCR